MMNGSGVNPAQHPFRLRRKVLSACDVGMVVAAGVAISALALEHGFHESGAGSLPWPGTQTVLHVIQACVLAMFVLDRAVRLVFTADRGAFLRENWIDLALIAGAGGVALAARQFQFKVLSAASVYIVITQVYIVAVLVVRLVSFNVKVAGSGIHPMWVLIGSFAMVILFGTGLLMLPRAVPQGDRNAFTDALFTATSATCVTGLLVRDTAAGYTPFGQAVILMLIQLGGLGIMVFGTLFALLAGRQLSIREGLLAGQVLGGAGIGRIGRVVKFAVLSMLAVEAAGAAAMYPMWARHLADRGGAPWTAAAFRSAFHAVSAFCNAGFALQSDNLTSVSGWQVLGVMAPLIFLGGLGFPVLYDLTRAVWGRVCAAAGRPWPGGGKLTLHTKLVLSASAVLLVGGAVGLLIIENASHRDQTYGAPYQAADNPYHRPAGAVMVRLDAPGQVGAAVFHSVSARTAGFNTVEMDGLSAGGKLWMCLLMIVGGSPASTAGGMKTVTVAVLALSIWCMLRRRDRTEGFQRSIDQGFLRKAVTLAGLYLTLLVLVALLLCVSMSGRRLEGGGPASFIQLLFEACSACGTVGLSCGVTRSLTVAGKYVIIAAMFIGRLGPLTLLLALTARLRAVKYAYPSEEVILG